MLAGVSAGMRDRLTFGVAAMAKVAQSHKSKLIASSPIGAFVVDGVVHTIRKQLAGIMNQLI